MTEFDPAAVPAFPVARIQLTAYGTATVYGTPVPVTGSGSPTEDAVIVVADLARQEGLDAIRAQAVTPDGEHLMVVTSDGHVYDITPAAEPEKKGRRNGVLIGAAALGVLALVGAGTAVAVNVTQKPAPVASSTPYTPPGAGVQLPVLAPPGYSQIADYAIPLSKSSEPRALPDGRIAVTGTKLQLIDPDTGKTVWTADSAGPKGTDVHYSVVGGKPVLASASNRSLDLWPLYLDDTTDVPSTSFELNTKADVSYLGSSPLVSLPSQTVGFVTADGIKTRDLPVTATAVFAADDTVTAIDSKTWWSVPLEGKPEPHPLPKPDGAESIVLASAADDTHLIVVWDTDDDQVATLVDLESNTLVATAPVDDGAVRDRDEPIRAQGNATLTLGRIFIDYGKRPVIVDLGKLVPSSVDGNIVYGTQDRDAVVGTVNAAGVATRPFTAEELPEDPALPLIATTDRVWVVATKLDQRLLYALPPTEGDTE